MTKYRICNASPLRPRAIPTYQRTIARCRIDLVDAFKIASKSVIVSNFCWVPLNTLKVNRWRISFINMNREPDQGGPPRWTQLWRVCVSMLGRWFVHPPRNPKDIHNTAKIVSTVHQNTNKLIQKFEINQETCTLLESLCRELAQLNARTARCSWQPSRFEDNHCLFGFWTYGLGCFWDTLSLSRFHLRSCINTNHASRF